MCIRDSGWIEPDSFYEPVDTSEPPTNATADGTRLYERAARIDDDNRAIFVFMSIHDEMNMVVKIRNEKPDLLSDWAARKLEELRRIKARAISNGWALKRLTADNTRIEPEVDVPFLKRAFGEEYFDRVYGGMSPDQINVSKSAATAERWMMAGDLVRASQEFERATRILPEDPSSWRRLAEVQAAMRDKQAALASLARFESLIPEPRDYAQTMMIAALRDTISALP